MNEEEARAVVERIRTQLEGLRRQWQGQPLHIEEVLANTVFWGALLTQVYPDAVDAAQLLIAAARVQAEVVTPEDKLWN